MAQGYVIETRDGAAGVAVRDGKGYRFFASRRPFYTLDQHTFPRLRAVHSAVEAVAKAEAGADRDQGGRRR
jgi:hypothetical protein